MKPITNSMYFSRWGSCSAVVFAVVEPPLDVGDIGAVAGEAAAVTSSPTRSPISSRRSASLLSRLNSTGVCAYSRRPSSPLSVSVETVHSRVLPGSVRAEREPSRASRFGSRAAAPGRPPSLRARRHELRRPYTQHRAGEAGQRRSRPESERPHLGRGRNSTCLWKVRAGSVAKLQRAGTRKGRFSQISVTLTMRFTGAVLQVHSPEGWWSSRQKCNRSNTERNCAPTVNRKSLQPRYSGGRRERRADRVRQRAITADLPRHRHRLRRFTACRGCRRGGGATSGGRRVRFCGLCVSNAPRLPRLAEFRTPTERSPRDRQAGAWRTLERPHRLARG